VAVRTIEGPGKSEQRQHVSTKEAAEFMGVEVGSFRKLVKEEQEREGGGWLRPVHIGGKTCWYWLDIVCFAHLYRRRQEAAAASQPEQGGPGKKEK
jgi:hypothetical protein